MVHDFEVCQTVYQSLVHQVRRHDLRRDPGFDLGDRVRYREIDAAGVRTGREWWAEIGYVTSSGSPCALSDDGLVDGHSIIALRPTENPTYSSEGDLGA